MLYFFSYFLKVILLEFEISFYNVCNTFKIQVHFQITLYNFMGSASIL